MTASGYTKLNLNLYLNLYLKLDYTSEGTKITWAETRGDILIGSPNAEKMKGGRYQIAPKYINRDWNSLRRIIFESSNGRWAPRVDDATNLSAEFCEWLQQVLQ